MASILIAYASHYGQTRKIADRMAQRLRGHGHDVELRDAKDVGTDVELVGFGGVVLGASVHRGSYPSEAIEFARAHGSELEQIPSVFFSVSMSAASDDEHSRQEERSYLDHFSEVTGWRPALVASFGGALAYRRYGFFVRHLMKFIARRTGRPTDTSRDHEFTDWDAVDRLADEIGSRVQPPAPAPRPPEPPAAPPT